MSATHRVNVNTRNIHHWSWSLDGGAETHMPAGSTYVDITIGSAPEPEPDVGLLLQNTTGIGLHFSGTTVGPNPISMSLVATEKSGTNIANGTVAMNTNQGNGSASWVINESGDLTLTAVVPFPYSFGNFIVTWTNWYQNYLDGTTSSNSTPWGPNTVFASSYSNQTVRLIVP
jgi:hypothetical protein